EGDVAMFTVAEWNLGGLNFEFGIAPIPKGPDQTTSYTYANSAAAAKFIGKGVKDPDLVYQIFEETFDIPMLEESLVQPFLETIYRYEHYVIMLRDHTAGTGVITVDQAFPDFPTCALVDDVVVNQISPAATAEDYYRPAAESLTKPGPYCS